MPKYKRQRIDEILSPYRQHSKSLIAGNHFFLCLLCLHRLGGWGWGCGCCLLGSLLCHVDCWGGKVPENKCHSRQSFLEMHPSMRSHDLSTVTLPGTFLKHASIEARMKTLNLSFFSGRAHNHEAMTMHDHGPSANP